MKPLFSIKLCFTVIVAIFFFSACQKPAKENQGHELKKDSRLIQVNGTELYAFTMGTGEPLLVIHGGPGMSHGYFLPHLESLTDKYQLIFYDHRASGQSSYDVDSSSMTMRNFVLAAREATSRGTRLPKAG